MREIELGQALEELLESDGWKHIDAWIEQQETKATSDLKTKEFTYIGEVKALQVKLKAYKELRGEIHHRIQKGREAAQKQE